MIKISFMEMVLPPFDDQRNLQLNSSISRRKKKKGFIKIPKHWLHNLL